MYPLNNVFQFPSGKWGFVGRVSVWLGWQRKDGTPLTLDDAMRLPTLSNPAMLYKTRSYDTREDAIRAAKELGQPVTE